jgi:RNA polymerase sigma factor (sigma-70 family)
LYGRVRPIETVEETPAAATLRDAVTVGELEDARLAFFHLLSRRCGREFKERHGDELFAQAAYEFSRKLEMGKEIRSPAGWLVGAAWDRAIDEVRAQDRRPKLVPTESLPAEPVAEPSWQPEESFLSADRMRRVRDAVDQLPDYQRELIARHYFEEESVREISRKLGWSEGKGARAHNAARKRLRLILGEDPDRPPLRVETGLAAFLSASAAAHRAAAAVPGGLEAALHRVLDGASRDLHRAVNFARHPLGSGRSADLAGVAPQSSGRISQLGRRIVTSPVAETAAAAGDGPGRMVEVCKVLAVCAVSGTAVTAGVIGVGSIHQHNNPPPTAPAPRQSEEHPRNEGPSEPVVQAPPAKDPAAETIPSHPQTSQGSAGSKEGSVAHSVSGSKTAAAPTAGDTQTPAEQSKAEEGVTRREAFNPYEGRGEAASSETGTSGASVESLSTAKTSPAPTEPTEPSASTSPKESAEKKGSAEMFHRSQP